MNRRSKHELLHNQISAWKVEAITNISAIFSVEKGVIKKNLVPQEKLYARIGVLATQTTICNPEHKKYPYLLRNLLITRKNQVWATDITYIPMKQGFMYLTAIIDLHTRFVLNWDVSNTMTAEWCAKLVKETIEKHGCPEIFNTDQGSPYTSDVHTKVLLDNDIKISMD